MGGMFHMQFFKEKWLLSSFLCNSDFKKKAYFLSKYPQKTDSQVVFSTNQNAKFFERTDPYKHNLWLTFLKTFEEPVSPQFIHLRNGWAA